MNSIRRTDIDTLRAVSVISVIIYHINNTIFPNGYLGVDLFFVISGYVITKSIFKNIKNNNFSFYRFYLRRAKRILPVLLVVLIATLIFSYIILLTADFKRFTESLISSLGFVSNFYFWITGGYFSTNDHLKPLLHLWSLSVEEQFYLFFPVFIYVVYKFFNKLKYYLISAIIISVISYYLNFIFLSHTDTVFFLFPTRIWQFGIGVIFALAPNIKFKNLWMDSFYLLLAILLIIFNFIYSINFLPDATIMCLGLGLILFKEVNEKNFVFNIFKIKFLVFIGLISYSLYLWHWPIISLLKYISVDFPQTNLIFAACIIIFILSVITRKYIEEPFLNTYQDTKTIKFISFNYIMLLIFSILIVSLKNIPSRYDKFPNLLAEAINSTYDCPQIMYRKFENTYGCYVNDDLEKPLKNILLGNSHAFMYGWPFREHLKTTNQKGIILQFSCLPFIDKNSSTSCLKKARLRFNAIISSKDSKNVLIGLTWSSDRLVDERGNIYLDKDFEIRKKSINYLVDKLKENNKNIYLIGPISTPDYDFASDYSRRFIFNKQKGEMKKPREEFEKNYSAILIYFEKKLGNNFLQPHKLLCDDSNCFFADNEGSYFSDSNHLSKYGSMKMLQLFKKIN